MNSGATNDTTGGDPAWPHAGPRTRCPCLSGFPYGECCAPSHSGVAEAPTPERLMRSRYSAFVLGDARYLEHTWHPVTRPSSLDLDTETRWFGLEVLESSVGATDQTGSVKFVARFRSNGVVGELRETSRFVRLTGRWVYLDGVVAT